MRAGRFGLPHQSPAGSSAWWILSALLSPGETIMTWQWLWCSVGLPFSWRKSLLLIAKRLGKPVVFYLHGGNLPDFTSRHPAWAKRVLQRGSAVCSPSGYLAEFFNQIGLSVRVIPNVIDIEKYPFHLRAQVSARMLWMRTFHQVYNPEMAVSVLAELLRTHPEAYLTMAGQDSGLVSSIKQKVQAGQLGSQVRFAGFLGSAEKQRELSSHDIYLHTNRIDNMPVSVVEAAAFGLPIVATPSRGYPLFIRT